MQILLSLILFYQHLSSYAALAISNFFCRRLKHFISDFSELAYFELTLGLESSVVELCLWVGAYLVDTGLEGSQRCRLD